MEQKGPITKVYVLSIEILTPLGMMSTPVEVWTKGNDATTAATDRNPNEFVHLVLQPDSDVQILQSFWKITEVNLDAKHTGLSKA